MHDEDRLGARPYLVAAVLFGVMLVGGLTHTELWPAAPWDLFSRTRGPEQTGHVARASRGDVERTVDFGAMPLRYRSAAATLARFRTMSRSAQRAVCAAWADGVEASGLVGGRPTAIRIYEVRRRFRLDGRAPVRTERLVEECTL